MRDGLNRRAMLIGLGATTMGANASTSSDWATVSPADAGLATDLGARIDAAQASGELTGLHSVLITRSGRLALERYYRGKDEAWGRQLGEVAFALDQLHDLRSVTKSVVGLLYGIALEQGRVPPSEAVLIEQFPEYPDLQGDPARRKLTIAHALNMTLGIEWYETSDYTDPRNAEIAMIRAPDGIRYVLERPIAEAPGQRWHYCGGATALLARLIARGSGQTLEDFAQANLFAPLGITAFEWARAPDGIVSAASGLRLRPRDLARIGQLVLQRGEWQGRQLVPAAWLEASTRKSVTIDGPFGYGRHWYLGEANAAGKSQAFIAGIGNGGQRLIVVPGIELVATINAGNYDKPDQGLLPTKLWRDFILPSVRAS